MFGDMMGMMGKLKETQEKVEQTKKRMNTVLLDETSSDNKLKVTITADREIKAISIDDELAADLLTKMRTAHQAIHLFQQSRLSSWLPKVSPSAGRTAIT